MTIVEPSRVDDEALRLDRRRRLFDAMAMHGLDALVLGRPAEVTFATGARQLWTAGSRPFGPACVVVRSTGRTHLLSVSDFDVPTEVGHDDLYGLSWNPGNLVTSLTGIPGLAEARRVGTTSSSPGFPRLLAAVALRAEVVDGAAAMWTARIPKSADEIDRIRAAIGIAEAGLGALVAALRPGVTERGLVAAYLERIASVGAPTPPTEGVVCATAASGPVTLRRLATTTPIKAGQLVALDPGGFHRGYEGGIGRTVVCSAEVGVDSTSIRHPRTQDLSAAQAGLVDRGRAALDSLTTACRAGATGADLLTAWTGTGEPLPSVPLAHGVGLGVEPPVIGAGVGAASVLAPSTVLALTSWVTEPGVGGFLQRDLVVITEAEPVVLTGPEG